MKLRLAREVEQGRRTFPKGLVGEPTLMIWDDDGRVVEIEMVFYGCPGVYMISAADLENL